MKPTYFILLALIFFSCSEEIELINCNSAGTVDLYNTFYGEYTCMDNFGNPHNNILIGGDAKSMFISNGISGQWDPPVPLTSILDKCNIIIDVLIDEETPGALTPDGKPRYYYDSITGYGSFYPESDSISLTVNIERRGYISESFSGQLFLS